jgi:hypothetical protein
VQQGRTIAQIKKASTFRLAMWSRGLKSAIWQTGTRGLVKP